MPIEISSQSRQYVKVPVYAKLAGAVVNPTADTVQMAFPRNDVDPGTWYAATWETDSTVTPSIYLARCTVGPGGTAVLTPGSYDVYVKVTDNPEIPVLRSPVRLKVF